jgi:DinB superfamily
MKLEYSPGEYMGELQRQCEQAKLLVSGLDDIALNWQPDTKGWSIAQCLDHLVIMNGLYAKALVAAIDNNCSQLKPRKAPIHASGWLARLLIKFEEPPPKLKLPAPRKISPPSQLTSAILVQFEAVQNLLIEFVHKWGEADLGDLRMRDPLFPLHLPADTLLLIIAAHNRRHLWQAEQVRKHADFPTKPARAQDASND